MKTIRTLHRRVAIVMGVFMAAWIVSGIVMVLPRPTPRALADHGPSTPDFAAAALSPAEAVQRLRAIGEPEADVVAVELLPLADAVVYALHERGGSTTLLDARTGAAVEITPALAEKLVRARVAEDVGPARVERIDRHSPTYPWGALPAYRIEFENGRGTIAYVSGSDGAVSFTDWRTQLFRVVSAVHDFGIVKLLLGVDGVHHKLLAVAGIVTLVLVVTGYQLVLVPVWRRRRRATRNA